MLRATLLTRRTQRDQAQCVRDGRALAGLVAALPDASTVACYAGIDLEPPTAPLIQALQARGSRVILPVVRADGGLDWSSGGTLVRRRGLLEPVGGTAAALSEAGLVLVPALAVDRQGHRLGRGGGFYDRALADLARTTKVLAVVFDDELLDAVPVDAHDRSVDGALTPAGVVLF